jgi:CheY-like chemotaxis protein
MAYGADNDSLNEITGVDMIKFKLFGFGGQEQVSPAASGETEIKETPSFSDSMEVKPNGKRVLIVDDDPVFLRATTMKLNSAGFEVATAKEGPEAIAALGENPADVILMDISFPTDPCNGGMGSWDGFQIMYWLRGLPTARGARFFMVSNSDSALNRKRAQELGAEAYFQKPLDYDQLVAAVNAGN